MILDKTHQSSSNTLLYYITAHLLIVIGYSANKGAVFHSAQLFLLLLGLGVLMLPFAKKQWLNFNFKIDIFHLLLAANLINFVLFYFFDGPIHFVSPQADLNITIFKLISLVIFFFYLVDFKVEAKNIFSVALPHLKNHKFIYLVVLALLMRLATIFYSPNPTIDVFLALEGAAEDFIAGNNPYSTELVFHNYLGEEVVHHKTIAYLPASIIATTLSKGIFGDIRFAFVITTFLSALIIYSLLRKHFDRRIAELTTLLFLYIPLSLFVLEQAWVDSLSIFFLYLFVYLFVKEYKFLPYVAFGLMLATKQSFAPFLFFIFKIKGIDYKRVSLIFLTVAILATPFLLWNLTDFLDDVVFDHLRRFEDPPWSLSITNLVNFYFNFNIPTAFIVLVLISLLAYLLVKSKRDLAGIIHASLVLMLVIFLFKRGFPNYYFSISGGLVILLVLELLKTKNLDLKL